MSTEPLLQPTSIAQPARCKLCKTVVGHFAVSWPSDTPFNQQEFARLFKALSHHMQQRAQAGDPKHQGALMHAAAIGGNLTQVFIARHFQLPEAVDGYLEQCRGSVNHMTSKFTLTPDYAKELAKVIMQRFDEDYAGCNDPNLPPILPWLTQLLLALAARYEEGHPTPEKKEAPPEAQTTKPN